MNIKDIDLIALQRIVKNDEKISKNDIELVERILFGTASEGNTSVDLIIVLGHPNCIKERLPKAVEMFKSSKNSFLMLCGGVAVQKDIKTESQKMYEECLRQGIDKNSLLLENRSKTTTENIIFAAELINTKGIKAENIAIVTSPPHLRRAMMNLIRFKDMFPGTDSFFTVGCYMNNYVNGQWINKSEYKKTMETELGFIDEYLYKLGFHAFEI